MKEKEIMNLSKESFDKTIKKLSKQELIYLAHFSYGYINML